VLKRILMLFMTLLLAFPAVAEEAPVLLDRINAPETAADFAFAEDAPLLEVIFPQILNCDAILLRCGGETMLVDCATQGQAKRIINMCKQLGVTRIDRVVNTHPHEDHIGGADMVLNTYNVKNVVLPDATSTSKTFGRMMDAIEAEGCEVMEATPDKTFRVGELTCTVLAPMGGSYTETNNYSVVIRAEYGDTSVLFTGDAETVSEKEMLECYRLGGLLDCDLLKAGHHGSDTSSSQAFLDAVTPAFAVISCGVGNDYGHPDREIVSRFESMGITYYRTDLEGSIVFVSTGGEPSKK
jgi:competence protein ComEC